MSIKVMSWVWEQDLPPLDKIVLMAIADHADDDGYAWPGMKRIAEKCSMEKRTVQRHVEKLQEQQLLKVESRQRNDGSSSSNGYTVVMDGTKEEGVAESHPPMSGMTPPHGTDDTPLTVIEPSEETTTTTTSGSIAKSLADALPKVMESVRNLPPITNQLEGDMPDLRDKVTLDEGTGRSWHDIVEAQLQAQRDTEKVLLNNGAEWEATGDDSPLTLLEVLNDPEWLTTLADVVTPTVEQRNRIMKWARNHEVAVLTQVAYSAAEGWAQYKKKNKSLYNTFMNWVGMQEKRDAERGAPAEVLPRSQQNRYGAEAYIQNQGLHPSSEEAKKIRREWSNGV